MYSMLINAVYSYCVTYFGQQSATLINSSAHCNEINMHDAWCMNFYRFWQLQHVIDVKQGIWEGNGPTHRQNARTGVKTRIQVRCATEINGSHGTASWHAIGKLPNITHIVSSRLKVFYWKIQLLDWGHKFCFECRLNATTMWHSSIG